MDGYNYIFVSTSAGSVDSTDVPVRVADNMRVGDMTSTRPWDGDQPPRSIFVDSIFVRRDAGNWCKPYTVGRLYLANMNGERCAKPRNLDVTSGQNHDQLRPSSISPHVFVEDDDQGRATSVGA